MFRTLTLTLLYAVLLASDSRAQSAPAARPEQPGISGAWQGQVETLIVDNPQSVAGQKRLFLRTPHETLELQGTATAGLRAGQQVEVHGRASGGRLAAAEVHIAKEQAAGGSCAATGAQNVAVILVSFPSKALLSSVTPALMRQSFFGDGQTVDQFLRESSFGQTWVTGDVLGPFVLDADYFGEPLSVRDAALRAAASSADLTRYNRFFVVAPQGQTGMESGGMALLGCGPISSPQGTLNASSIWLGAETMVAQDAVVSVASHEFGHAFGLEHARYADFGSDTLGPAGQTPALWDGIHEYGDSFSSMGRQFAQWAAPHKAQLGWLQGGANIQEVSAGGGYTVAPYEQAGGGQVLRISRGTSPAAWLWLEFRQPLGIFDATLPQQAFAGALVHYEDPAMTPTVSGVDPALYTNLVNFHTAALFASDPALHAGESWTDPYGTLSLTVNSAAAAGLNVSVAYAPAPACPASVGAAQSFDATGGGGQIAVTAPAACAWSSAASVSWISLASNGSGTGNGSVSFTVAANANVSPRWGKITVGGDFVIVTQAGSSSGWTSLTPQSAWLPAGGGTGEISVATSAPDYAWAFQSDVPWITDVECSCGQSVGPATLRYIVAANSGPQRTGTITAGGIQFAITQSGGTAAPGSLTWQPLAPVDAPAARLETALAAFGHSGQAILYGGAWNTDVFADTWLWNGGNWTLLQPANNPGPLANHAMAYDEARGQIVLFGGLSGAGVPSGQTWVWDGGNWRQMQPAASPSARFGHAMAYDPIRRKVVLFGGTGPYGESNDTWTWDGTNWAQVDSPASPLPRSGHAMAFDAVRGAIVLFGGMAGGGTPTWFSDTWVWNASGWHQMFSAAPPSARFGHVLAYHPALHAVVLIGGYGGKDVGSDGTWHYDFHRDTWVWNGTAWVQQFPENQPGPAYTMGTAYDDVRQALITHVGDDLTCDSRGPKTLLLKGTATAATQSARPAPGSPASQRPRRSGWE